uniref:Gag-Pol polyprotein n=1 Tax=Tanacetum cinerariifolium TaxID=118510 RepID=A0A699HZ88_TANCI|nr:hypothetical protein [Tanacetum cinerariifolium]
MQIAQLASAKGNGNGINGHPIRCYNCRGEDGSAETHLFENCYDKYIFNMFTQEEKYTELLEPIPEPHQVPQNDSNAIYEVSSVEQGGGTVEQHLKALELEIKRLLRAVVSQNIMSVVQHNSVIDTSNLQTELECTKERFENYIIKKENEYAKIWIDWYKKYEEYKYDKISYDKAYNDMQQKIERLQAQLRYLKGKIKDTSSVSSTLNPLPQNLENENIELEFHVWNYEKENAHLKTAYKNLFDSINVTRTQTKTIIDSLQTKLHDTIYENAKLRAQLFNKVSGQKDTARGMSANAKFAKKSILGKPPSFSRPKLYVVTPLPKSTIFPKVGETHALSKPVTSNSAPTPTELKVMKNDNVISPGIFKINPFKASWVDNFVPNKHVKASVMTKPITVSQPHVITKNDVNSKTNGFSSKDVKSTTRTRRP